MAETATKVFPEYVTDGSHIYMWHPEFESLFTAGKLQASDAPVPPKVVPLTPKQKVKLEEARKRALKEAEMAVALFSHSADKLADTNDLFGSPPK